MAHATHPRNTLVLELGSNGRETICTPIPEFYPELRLNTGARVDGKFVSCGGLGTPSSHECRIYKPAEKIWKRFPSTIESRYRAESVQLSEDSFWILGTGGVFFKIRTSVVSCALACPSRDSCNDLDEMLHPRQ